MEGAKEQVSRVARGLQLGQQPPSSSSSSESLGRLQCRVSDSEKLVRRKCKKTTETTPIIRIDEEKKESSLKKGSCSAEWLAYMKWKKKQGIGLEQKVFIVKGWYPVVRQALKDMGWAENVSGDERFFDLKWTLRAEHLAMQNWQRANHFFNSQHLVTKAGLSRTLAEASFVCDESSDAFFPRCYDLSTELGDFFRDFYAQKAKRVLENIKDKVNGRLLAAALRTCAKCALLDDDDDNDASFEQEAIDLGILTVVDEEEDFSVDALVNFYDEVYGTLGHRKSESKKIANMARSALKDLRQQERSLTITEVESVRQFLGEVRQPQADGPLSLWIVKPAAKSRGRGIAVFRHLLPLLRYCRILSDGQRNGEDDGGLGRWVVQKYLEHQTLIHQRKMDMRQWVCVSSWAPLTIWFYDECYVRFAAEEYTTDDAALTNKFVHLVNNSISKKKNNVEDECMWRQSDLQDHLGEEEFTKIQLLMKKIVVATLRCAAFCGHKEDLAPNKNFELFGFDFMLDAQRQPWLIEVNSSPACDYSTSVTETFVRRALRALLVLLVGDSSEAEDTTTKWTLIYKSKISKNTNLGVVGGVVGETAACEKRQQMQAQKKPCPPKIHRRKPPETDKLPSLAPTTTNIGTTNNGTTINGTTNNGPPSSRESTPPPSSSSLGNHNKKQWPSRHKKTAPTSFKGREPRQLLPLRRFEFPTILALAVGPQPQQ